MTTGTLLATKVRWRWPRLKRAGVLAGVIDDLSGGAGTGPFLLPLELGHARPFRKGDIVRLRTRPLLTAGLPSRRLKVTRKHDADTLEVELAPGSILDPAAFPVGSVVMVPRRAPGPDPANGVFGADLELIAASIRNRIDTTHNPLNAADGDPADRPCTGLELPTPTGAMNFPGGKAPKPPRYSSWIVGLYENGAAFDCDVYRPSGICIMCLLVYKDPKLKRDRAYQFCPVCRYVMVDLVDPSKHCAIDRDYTPRYPA